MRGTHPGGSDRLTLWLIKQRAALTPLPNESIAYGVDCQLNKFALMRPILFAFVVMPPVNARPVRLKFGRQSALRSGFI